MKRLGAFLLALGIVALASCQDATEPLSESPTPQQSKLLRLDVGQVVPDEYIVVFNQDVEAPPALARDLTRTHAGTLLRTYQHGLKGFAVRLPRQAVEALSRHSSIAYIEPNRPARLFDTQSDPPSWGLDRVDERDLPLDDQYVYNNDGSGANVYIFDTGVRDSHNDFEGRVSFVPNGNNGDFVNDGHGSAEDCHGHGTHVAGTAAGEQYGIAKEAKIWAARVVNCSGSGDVSMVLDAIDWVNANGEPHAVVNMSLGYGDVQSLRDAVETSVNDYGINYSVAAGNGHWLFGFPLDACNESPAGAASALTVGATESDDDEASFSNYGTCVDLLAPGVSIVSDYYSNDNATATMSGTSMATPHVTGAVALYLTANPSATPAEVADALKSNATQGVIDLHRRSQQYNTPNRLLYTTFIGGGGPQNQDPTADPDGPYDGTEDVPLTFDGSGSDDPDDDPLTYEWNFGDGSTGSGVSPTHTYLYGGSFTVELTVNDGRGGSDTKTTTATITEVNDVPVADPNGPYSGTVGEPVSFDGSGSYDYDNQDGTAANDQTLNYSWDFGDGQQGSGVSPTHTYAESGDYTVTLTVNDGTADSDPAATTASISVEQNDPPTASFTYDCTGLTCDFTDTSTDSDGTVVSWSWTFGDGGTSTAQNPSHTYGAGGTYTVALEVTDDDGATGETSQQVEVSEPGQITLTATGGTFYVWHYANLEWSGASGSNVDIYRNGSKLTTTANDGFYRDRIGTGTGTFTYKVCEEGSSTCSNESTVSF